MNAHDTQNPVPLATTLPNAARRLPWLERLSRYRQPLGLALTLLLFSLALVACRHLLSELDIHALHDALLSVPGPSLAAPCWLPHWVSRPCSAMNGRPAATRQCTSLHAPSRWAGSVPLPLAMPSACRSSLAARCVIACMHAMAWAQQKSPA